MSAIQPYHPAAPPAGPDAAGAGPPMLRGAEAVKHAMAELKLIRTFVAGEMTEGLDFGTIPGTDKPTIYLPGAQKIAMYFNCMPIYEVKSSPMAGGHIEYLVDTRLVSRQSAKDMARGIGSCSTMEKKYRYRGEGRSCPECNAVAIKKSKYPPRSSPGDPPGWYCHDKAGGCGANFAHDDPAIVGQSSRPVENPDIYDVRNTVLKMAKKRSFVDAVLSMSCLAEKFTQDLEDVYDLTEEGVPKIPAGTSAARRPAGDGGPAAIEGPPPAKETHFNNSGHGSGKFASDRQVDAYNRAIGGYVSKRNAAWADRWVNEFGEVVLEVEPLFYPQTFNTHLAGLAERRDSLRFDVPVDRVSPATLPKFLAILWAHDREAVVADIRSFADQHERGAIEAIYKSYPELRPPEDQSQDDGIVDDADASDAAFAARDGEPAR